MCECNSDQSSAIRHREMSITLRLDANDPTECEKGPRLNTSSPIRIPRIQIGNFMYGTGFPDQRRP